MVSLTMSDSFTGTEGSTNGNTQISKYIDLSLNDDAKFGMKNGYKSYSDFKKNIGRNGKKELVVKNLENLRKGLENTYSNTRRIDPIIYLAKLYYVDGLSVESVHTRTKELGLVYSTSSGLKHLLNKSLNWELRERNDATEIQRKRYRAGKQMEYLAEHNESYSKGNIEKFKAALLKVLDEKETGETKKEFSQAIYNSFTGKKSEKRNKVFYLLECHSGISLNDMLDTCERSGIGARTMTKVLNTKIDVIKAELKIEEDLKILPKSIHYFLAQRKKKKKANQ